MSSRGTLRELVTPETALGSRALGRESDVVPAGGARRSVAEALVEALVELGVEYAFGIFGGGIGPFCRALHESPIRLLHYRHEAGAAFAAIEASLASGRLVVVPVTTGPGLTNLYTGMAAARWEGARVLFVSGYTSAERRGRFAFQETSPAAPGLLGVFQAGSLFHHAAVIEHPEELAVSLAQLRRALAQPGGFVGHLGIALPQQTAPAPDAPRTPDLQIEAPRVSIAGSARIAELLAREPFVIWAGFGARHANRELCALAEAAGAPVMCSPRAKGCFPEQHPLYLGVTGLGGHSRVLEHFTNTAPERVLVLGTKLGEMTSFWSDAFVPSGGFVHVDLDPSVFGAAYPHAPTLGVPAEIGGFLRGLLQAWPSGLRPRLASAGASPFPPTPSPRPGRVRPSYLASVVQSEIVACTDSIVLTEAGNAFAIGSHYLSFDGPRYRVSSGFGSMGQASAGVLGAALGARRKAVALVGDGALLMLNEINTAASYGIEAVWIVLNDAGYRMIAQGMQAVGWQTFETEFTRADFVSIARAMGADGVRVEREEDVAAALRTALAARGPFVVDVIVDPEERAPSGNRNQSLLRQGLSA